MAEQELMTKLVKVPRPKAPEAWSYEESVKTMKSNIHKWKTLTQEIITELYRARQVLRSQGSRTDISSKYTWEQYCKDIGVDKSTVNRWLNRWMEEQQLSDNSKPQIIEVKKEQEEQQVKQEETTTDKFIQEYSHKVYIDHIKQWVKVTYKLTVTPDDITTSDYKVEKIAPPDEAKQQQAEQSVD